MLSQLSFRLEVRASCDKITRAYLRLMLSAVGGVAVAVVIGAEATNDPLSPNELTCFHSIYWTGREERRGEGMLKA